MAESHLLQQPAEWSSCSSSLLPFASAASAPLHSPAFHSASAAARVTALSRRSIDVSSWISFSRRASQCQRRDPGGEELTQSWRLLPCLPVVLWAVPAFTRELGSRIQTPDGLARLLLVSQSQQLQWDVGLHCFFSPRAVGHSSTSSWTFQLLWESGLCYSSSSDQSSSAGRSMETGFKTKREPLDLRG